MADSKRSRLSRRSFVRSLAYAAAGGALAGCAGNQPTEQAQAQTPRPTAGKRPPNVLIIFPDQWRRQALGCYGDPVVRTPNLDRLAAEGVRFERCYTNNPVCSPARATIMTSRYPHQTGMIHNNLLLRPEEVTIAECLRDAGYATEYIGKWHLDGQAKPGFVRPGERRQGFESFEGFNRGHWYHNPQYFTNEGKLIKPEGFESFYQTDLAINFMKKHKDQPFFVYLAWGPPHMPYRPPEEFDRFTAADLKWRPNVPQKFRSDKRTIQNLCGYYGLCEALDHEVGRLLKFLDESGLAQNTLVLFTADHGDMHGSHGLRYKTHPEEESAGIPLIARLPGVIPNGLVSKTLISLIDIMPTVLSLCGLPVPKTAVGRDLSAAFKGKSVNDEPLYLEGRMQVFKESNKPGQFGHGGYGAWRAIVTPQHKLAVDFTGKVRLLVDLEKDPYELNNLADKPEAAALQKELLAQLKEIGKRTGDPFPEPVPPTLSTDAQGNIIST